MLEFDRSCTAEYMQIVQSFLRAESLNLYSFEAYEADNCWIHFRYVLHISMELLSVCCSVAVELFATAVKDQAVESHGCMESPATVSLKISSIGLYAHRKRMKTATSSAITSPPIQTNPKVYELRCLNCPFGPSPQRRILS